MRVPDTAHLHESNCTITCHYPHLHAAGQRRLHQPLAVVRARWGSIGPRAARCVHSEAAEAAEGGEREEARAAGQRQPFIVRYSESVL